MVSLTERVDQLQEENLRLRESLATIQRQLSSLSDASLSSSGTSSKVSSHDVETAVEVLVESYRSLRTDHEEVVARYAADCRKWRRFKQWLLVGVDDKEASTRLPLAKKVGKENVGDEALEAAADLALTSVQEQAVVESASKSLGKRRARESPASPTPTRKARLVVNQVEDADDLETDNAASKPLRRNGRYSHYEQEALSNSASASKINKGEAGFKYEEVVRNKQERRRLHGTDCECCRDYYEAVGPLPARLQAPLWRTPPSSPAKRRPGHSHLANDSSGDEHDVDVQDHKQQISRHRARWEAPKTPPGYWNIGFPDTQEVEAIHKAAAELREQEAKKARRESEARTGSSKRK
ncbi:DNA repair protein endonuclease SAE2/CtIP C-terminus-domain-containing protein [Phanerochaete sordida]|uniref:DNA repair protein endonuclease SAE2/CtIP C-terminus-domain-containing protein n=1 Tax=Phanerochaete sordida TaxID=48140 RepID=A0A9P3GP80_9APHY|nr:DNA repair protein endonuclease SAE2/CtIP C-terminus-domain-containing protein [Phanerochaete sordida]